ncbi:MerR family transcriptional regulator [Nocardioides daeguensis]|nr:MerR family transcriptional regulator [Nocardioides daeguensis]MBV6729807.1 MerR family transcriptional regulator [Nocardioides daeguensis]MCR1775378.1 MerR family transcriptional regulator [Nocardioides daeguensis]
MAYSIREAAEALEVGINTLRQWERQGLITPARTAGNQRRYTEDDVVRLRRVLWLRRAKGYSTAEIARLLQEPGEEGPPAERPATPMGDIGARLRAHRHSRRLTLRDVAEKVGLSISQLSAIERGTSNPSVASLQRLAKVYETSPIDLMQSSSPGKRLVRSAERPVSLEAPSGLRIERAATGTLIMRPEVLTVPAGSGSDGVFEHAGEEFFFVLTGQLQVWLGTDEQYELATGDCLYFPSGIPHRWHNPGPGDTSVLSVDTDLGGQASER